MPRMRFIGGPDHGELRDIPASHDHYAVPAFTRQFVGLHPGTYVDSYMCCYERRVIRVGDSVKCSVMVLAGMSSEELDRRVADILQGTTEDADVRHRSSR